MNQNLDPGKYIAVLHRPSVCVHTCEPKKIKKTRKLYNLDKLIKIDLKEFVINIQKVTKENVIVSFENKSGVAFGGYYVEELKDKTTGEENRFTLIKDEIYDFETFVCDAMESWSVRYLIKE